MPRGPEPYLTRLQARVSKGDSLEEAAAHVGIELWRAKATFVRSGLPVPRPITRKRPLTAQERERLTRPRMRRKQQFPDEGILIGLQAMAVQRGLEMSANGPVTVTATYWDEHRDPSALPSSFVVKSRFGGWNVACEKAGIPVRPIMALSTGQRWTPEQCLAAARQFFAEGAGWTSTQYAGYSRGKALPSAPTIISHLGPWPALRASILG